MTTLAAGASTAIAIPLGSSIKINGSATAVVNNQPQVITNFGLIGPFSGAVTAYLTASSAVDYSIVTQNNTTAAAQYGGPMSQAEIDNLNAAVTAGKITLPTSFSVFNTTANTLWRFNGVALVDGGGSSGKSLRMPRLFAVMNNTRGGDVNALTTGVTTVAAGSMHQFMQSVKVVSRTSRFRFIFSNGPAGTANTPFTLAGKTEVPSKNGSGIQYPAWTFAGQPTYSVPAGGGALWRNDFQAWPLDAGDYFYLKGACSNGGAAFDMPNFGSPATVISGCPAGDFDSAFTNTSADATAVQKGTGVWTTGAFISNMFRVIGVETDCGEAFWLPGVTMDGDSIGEGNDATSVSWLNRMLLASGNGFQNHCISGSSQLATPKWAKTRLAVYLGDISISEDGRNAVGNTAELRTAWKCRRGAGAKKLVQSTTTDYIGLASGVLGESSFSMRAYQNSQKGTVDGPDVIWDIRSLCQQQIDSSLTGGTLTVSSASTAVVGTGTNFTEALCGSLLTRTDGTTIGSVLTVTDATNLVLTANTTQAHTAQAFTAQQWKYEAYAGATIATTKGSTAITMTGYVAADHAGYYAVAADGGVIGKITSATTLAAVANRTYSGPLSMSYSFDGLHPSRLGDTRIATAAAAAGYLNDLLSV